jgi:DNA-binding LacI/PurR family transcriptional regulator
LSNKTAVVSLRTVADRVGLAPCSVSAILNNTLASRAIPPRTKDRVFRAAAELHYRPNLWARSLRTKRTRLVAAITPDIGRAPAARVVAGVHSVLQGRGYLLALGTFDCNSDWLTISTQLRQRGVEGVIAIDATLPGELELPVAWLDLEYLTLSEPLADDMRTWLSELGKSAAETVLRQIEKETVPRRIRKIAPKLPSAYVAARLGADVDAREPA